MALVETVFATDPEFNRLRQEDKAAPMRRARNLAVRVLSFEFGNPFGERFIALKLTALVGCPSGELTPARSGAKIGLGLRARGLLDATFDTDLALQPVPIESHRGVRISGELLRLATLVVGVKAETF